jgi:hypothetical protein
VHCSWTGETRPTCISQDWGNPAGFIPCLLQTSHCRTGETLPTQSLHVVAFRSHPMCSSLPWRIGPRAADGDGSQTGGQAVRCARVRLGRGVRGVRVRDAAAPLSSLDLLHSLLPPWCTGLNGICDLTCTLILSCVLKPCGALSLKSLTPHPTQVNTSLVVTWWSLHPHTGYQP